MYRPVRIVFGLLAGVLLFVGCSDDSPTDNGNNDTLPTDFGASVEINGTPWEADTAVFRTPALPSFTKEIVAWKGEENRGERITISLNDVKVGTYALTGSSNPDIVLQYITDLDSGPAFTADSAPASAGSVTITHVSDQYIAGTFSFTATGVFSGETFQATEGTFTAIVQ